MPFGLCNASATFQCLLNRVVVELEGYALYLNDVVIYSDTWFDHSQFKRVVWTRMTVNLAKCEFAKVVGQGQLHMLQDKVTAIVKYPLPPAAKKELMCFFRDGGILKKLLLKFSFENVKALLDDVFSLQVYASNLGAGALLLQKEEHGVGKPVAFFSRKFNRFPLSYSVTEKEELALIWPFDVFLGSGFMQLAVYTDHNPLMFLRSLQNPNQRLMRWALFLQQFHLDICHLMGSENLIADAHSHLSQ